MKKSDPQSKTTPAALLDSAGCPGLRMGRILAMHAVVIIIASTFAPGGVNAQSWLDRAKQAATNTSRAVSRTIERVDPKAKIMQVFASSPGLQRTVNSVTSDFKSLTSTLREGIEPYPQLKPIWNVSESVQTDKSPLAHALESSKLHRGSYKIAVNGSRYTIYNAGDLYLPFDEATSSMPLDERLDTLMLAACARSIAPNLKARSFGQISEISRQSLEASRAVASFTELGRRAFAEIRNYNVMGVSAIDVLDPAVRSASGGIGLTDIESTIRECDALARDVTRISREMSTAAGNVEKTLAMARRNDAEAAQLASLTRELESLGSSINELARPFEEFQREVHSMAAPLRRLKTFDTIGAVSAVVDVVVHVEESASGIAEGIKNYGNGFRKYGEGLENDAARITTGLRSRIKSTMASRNSLNEEFARSTDALSTAVRSLSSKHGVATPGVDGLAADIASLRSALDAAMEKDAIEASEAVDRFTAFRLAASPAALQDDLAALLSTSASSQWIGQPDVAVLGNKIVSLSSDDPAAASWNATAQLVASIQDVDRRAGRTNNLLLAGLAGVLAILVVAASVIIHRRRTVVPQADEQTELKAKSAEC